jgi:hypothetical protein
VPSGGPGGSKNVEPEGPAGGSPPWTWAVVLLLPILIASAWRYRSWLMGVFENVEVLGTSGADLEAELLHHEVSPVAPGDGENELGSPATASEE